MSSTPSPGCFETTRQDPPGAKAHPLNTQHVKDPKQSSKTEINILLGFCLSREAVISAWRLHQCTGVPTTGLPVTEKPKLVRSCLGRHGLNGVLSLDIVFCVRPRSFLVQKGHLNLISKVIPS